MEFVILRLLTVDGRHMNLNEYAAKIESAALSVSNFYVCEMNAYILMI